MLREIFFGLIGIVIGLFLCLKSEWLLRNFGRVFWAEKYLDNYGGTRLFYKLLGIAIIFLSVLYMTGGIEVILSKIFFLD